MKRKTSDDEDLENDISSSTRKRARSRNLEPLDKAECIKQSTPSKKRLARPNGKPSLPQRARDFLENESDTGSQDLADEEEDDDTSSEAETPSKRGRGRPKGSKNKPKLAETSSTPRKAINGEAILSTPKGRKSSETSGLFNTVYDADRSARRKSARTIIERTIADDVSENDEDEGLARQIYGFDEENKRVQSEDEVSEGDDNQASASAPTTPSKRGRGRPKGSKNRRSPTPPQDLPAHELYFAQNRGAMMKTSNNTLSSLALLDHEEYFTLMRKYEDSHNDDMEFLHELHSRSFNQWQFELSQGFSICIYGWGSKRKLLTAFAEHAYKSQTDHQSHKIVIVNGYLHNITIRDILNTLASAIQEHPPKLGSQVAEGLETICAMLEADKTRHIIVILNSIDAGPLRRSTTQALLARLASHSQISLIASADHPSFPILWDSSLRSTYNFLFHDCTTFQPYAAEVDVVNDVHELLGRSGRRVGGKEGVTFVLKSLNQNSRKLFQLLVAEQLASMDDGAGFGGDADEDDDDDPNDNDKRGHTNRRNNQGVEYRLLYQKAVEEFVCGDEVSFRTLLKEFHDHQMIQSRKDAMGTEMLSVPFRREELEMILEDLMA